MNGTELLAVFRNTGSEDAFRELMRLYTNLVYSVAKRRLLSAALAEDASQAVFIRLAKTLPKFENDAQLVAWLHRTAVHASIDMWRAETRRRVREQYAAAMKPAHAENAIWENISPVLDEALNRLNDVDRQALLLRFFDEKNMREIGGVLGISEDAAKMRISRAINRLRDQLVSRGVTCSALVLSACLTERSIEAASSHLVASLGSMKLPTVAGFGGIGIGKIISFLSKNKLAGIGITALLLVAGLMFFDSRSLNSSPKNLEVVSADSIAKERNVAISRFLATRVARRSASKQNRPPEKVRLMLRVLDAETGQGLANAKIQAVYFYAGGQPEGHNLVTDEIGSAAIPEARESGNPGMNVFVSIEGYVPKAMAFGKSAPAEYVLKLDPALTVGGSVIDEEGMPVADVRIEADRAEAYKRGEPNTDFQTTQVKTDLNGHWVYHYIPKNYESVTFHLTRSNYAITRVSVPVGTPESMNAKVVIKHGFIIVGRVSNSAGEPVSKATVRELPNFGKRKVSTKTDADGRFALFGLSDQFQPTAEIVVQAEGKSPQSKTVHLSERTNTLNFVLEEGNLFRGRVIDEMGNPIPKVVVQTDYDFQDQIDNGFEWRTETDADGKFQWNSAPAKPICYWFEADGYEIIRGRSILADGIEHEIRLARKTN